MTTQDNKHSKGAKINNASAGSPTSNKAQLSPSGKDIIAPKHSKYSELEMAELFAKDFGIDRQKYSRQPKIGKTTVSYRTEKNYNGSGGWSQGEPALSIPRWIVEQYAQINLYINKEKAKAELAGAIKVHDIRFNHKKIDEYLDELKAQLAKDKEDE